ncbi:MAG: hypothetical protein K1X36_12270 [Pyrinomonadaceae bacterium]|jgi:hypothetical protein|nr:hypothetical protein [Pyrinomonadaceae bacterium]
MQTRLRQEFDSDRTENFVSIAELRTGRNTHEIMCGVCFRPHFADDTTYESICRSIEQGLDNPFVCDDCQAAYDELEHREH